MWNCKHCNKEFDFDRTTDKANHSRHCDLNPKKLESYKKLKVAQNKVMDIKLGKIKSFNVVCHNCNGEFTVEEREKQFPTKEKYFCSRSCANSRERSAEVKKKISETLTGRSYIEPLIVEDICKCGTTFTYLKKGNKKRKYCSRSCGTKYSPSTIKRKEEARKRRTELENYRNDCSFKFNLNDYKDEFDFGLIEKYGWYKAKNKGDNQNGISRDHIISVRYGFDNNIPGWIISHPANCELMRHKDNVSKYTKCNLTLDKLIEKIDTWDKKYN